MRLASKIGLGLVALCAAGGGTVNSAAAAMPAVESPVPVVLAPVKQSDVPIQQRRGTLRGCVNPPHKQRIKSGSSVPLRTPRRSRPTRSISERNRGHCGVASDQAAN